MPDLTFEDGIPPLEWVLANPQGTYSDWVDSLAAGKGFKRGAKPRKTPAVAYVNHGRWVADCPLGDGGARRLKPGLAFFCIECGNTYPVEWPDKKTMAAVSTGLGLIPNATSQNFDPRVP